MRPSVCAVASKARLATRHRNPSIAVILVTLMRLVVNLSNPWSLSDTELLGVAPAADRRVDEEATNWIVADILRQDISFRRPNQEQWLFGEREHDGGGDA